MHAHQPMPTLPVDFHPDRVTSMNCPEIVVFEEMHDIDSIRRVARVDHAIIAAVDSQASGIARLPAAQRVKNGGR
jgi:hypothetical protein